MASAHRRGGTDVRSSWAQSGTRDDAFDALSLGRQRAVMRVAAHGSLRSHGIDATSATLLRFEDNAVYRVRHHDGPDVVLRVSAAGGHTEPQQRSEVALLDFVAARRTVTVPSVVRTAAGDGTILVEDGLGRSRVCVLFRWIDGRAAPRRLGCSTVKRAGAAVAELHEAALAFSPGADFERPSWTVASLLGADAPWRAVGPDQLERKSRTTLDDVARRAAATMGTASAESQARRLVHADLHRGNLVARSDEVAIIDFDDCGWGELGLDVATIVSSLRLTNHDDGLFQRKGRAFVDAYRERAGAPDDLVDLLPVHLVLRDMVIVNFVLTSANPTVRTWGPQRVAGILRHLEDFARTGTYPGDLR